LIKEVIVNLWGARTTTLVVHARIIDSIQQCVVGTDEPRTLLADVKPEYVFMLFYLVMVFYVCHKNLFKRRQQTTQLYAL